MCAYFTTFSIVIVALFIALFYCVCIFLRGQYICISYVWSISARIFIRLGDYDFSFETVNEKWA